MVKSSADRLINEFFCSGMVLLLVTAELRGLKSVDYLYFATLHAEYYFGGFAMPRRVVFGTEVNHSVTFNELVYLLFKKKECPKCGRDLKKYKDFTTRTETRSPLFKDGVTVKDYKDYFVCTVCESHFPITELSNKQKK